MPACKRLGNQGQATVEAAFALPLLFVCVLLLLQPGFLLYDRMVMQSAANEACRLLATRTEDYGSMEEACKAFVLRRVGSVPPVDCFHVHKGGCTWKMDFSGSESSEWVQVDLSTKVRPLPLADFCGVLLGVVDGDGFLEVKVSARGKVQPAWVDRADAGVPRAWVGAWLK